MSHYTPAVIEQREAGATNPRTGDIFDWFLRVRFMTGARTEIHDDGIIGDAPVSAEAPHPLISVALDEGRTYDLLLKTTLSDQPGWGPQLPGGWRLRMDLSGAEDAQLACRIVETAWRAPSLPYLNAYPELPQERGMLVESDLGRFVLQVAVQDNEEGAAQPPAHLQARAGDFLWWKGYLRFSLLAALAAAKP